MLTNSYYIVELLLIAAVPILNAFNIKVPYWTIPLIFVTQFVQMSFNQTQINANQDKMQKLYDVINKTQELQKDIQEKQKDLRDDMFLGGYN